MTYKSKQNAVKENTERSMMEFRTRTSTPSTITAIGADGSEGKDRKHEISHGDDDV